MSLSGILKPNGYNLFCHTLTCDEIITGSGSIEVDDLKFKTLTQISGSGSAHIDALGHITTGSGNISLNPSGGTISSLGEISSTAGFFTPASLTADIEVNTGVVNCVDVIASNDIISTAGSIATAGASMDSSGNIFGMRISTSGASINSSGNIVGMRISTSGASIDSSGNIVGMRISTSGASINSSGDIVCKSFQNSSGSFKILGTANTLPTNFMTLDSTGLLFLASNSLFQNGCVPFFGDSSFVVNYGNVGRYYADKSINTSNIVSYIGNSFRQNTFTSIAGSTVLTMGAINGDNIITYTGGASVNLTLPNYDSVIINTFPSNATIANNISFNISVYVGGTGGSQVTVLPSSDGKFVLFAGASVVLTAGQSRTFRCLTIDYTGAATPSFRAY